MPFTLAHPAAVLPLVRTPLSTIALVAGAVAPDIAYFVRAADVPVTAQSWYEPYANATTSHSLSALLPVCLPIALALYVCLLLMMPPVRSVLSGSAEGTRSGLRHGSSARLPSRCFWILAALVVGVLTHLAWDSFTHADGYVVTRVDVLTDPVIGDLTWARLLQHLSTILGLFALAYFAWLRRADLARAVELPPRRPLLIAAAACAIAALIGLVATTRSWLDPPPALTAADIAEGFVSDAALGAGIGVAVAVTLGTTAWWVRRALGAYTN